MSSAICFNFDLSKILTSGNGLKGYTLVVYDVPEMNLFYLHHQTFLAQPVAYKFENRRAKPHCSVGSIADLEEEVIGVIPSADNFLLKD